MKKILFVKGLANTTEWNLFQKLASAMGATAWVYGTPLTMSDPDILVAVHFPLTPLDLKAWGITSKPLVVQYHLGQTRKGGGYAIFDGRMIEFSDYHFGYGDMVQSEHVTMGWLPLPIDVSELPQRNVIDSIKFCTSQRIQMMWKRTYKVKPFLKELGYTLDYIMGLSRNDALEAMKNYNIYVGNFNYGNLGKSELEAMTMGLATVGWLKDSVKLNYEKLGANFPFVQANTDVFKTTIQNLTLNQVNNRGQLCRNWMLTNYTLPKLATYWRSTLEALT